MFRFRSSAALAANMNSFQTTAAARTAFDSGVQLIPTWDLLTAFDITNLGRQEYNIEQREPEILTTQPEPVSCGADIPTVGGAFRREPIEFVPSQYRVAIQMCKTECGPDDFEDKFLRAEQEAGAGFGKIMEGLTWFGDGFNPGLTRLTGMELFNATGTGYQDLDTRDAVTIANFFSMISQNMTNPRFYLGPITRELIGWRMQSSTGDTCSEVWDCVLSTLGGRLGETAEQVSARFFSIEAFDCMTGIDPNAPGAELPTLMVLDHDFMRMGITDEELGEAMPNGHDYAEVERYMHFTAPQALRYGAVKFCFNLVTAAKVTAATGTRYGPAGKPAITVQTPL